MKIIYVLPQKNFFSENALGRVSHAIGILNGLSNNGAKVTVVAEEGINLFQDRLNNDVDVIAIDRKKNYLLFFLEIFKSSFSSEGILLIRHNLFFILLTFPFIFLRRSVVEVNGFATDVSTSFKKFLTPITKFIYNITFLPFSSIYCVNEPIQKAVWPFMRYFKSVVVIENGGPKQNNLNHQLSTGKIDFLFYGGFNPYVGFDHLIKAFQSVNSKFNSQLHIVGFGPQQDHIEQLIKDDKNIIFSGKKNLTELREYLSKLDSKVVGLIPMNIRYPENKLKPIKAFEYMSLGLPLIYADCCFEGIIEDKKDSIMYATGSSKSLVNAMSVYLKKTEIYEVFSDRIKNIYKGCTWEERMKVLINSLKQ